MRSPAERLIVPNFGVANNQKWRSENYNVPDIGSPPDIQGWRSHVNTTTLPSLPHIHPHTHSRTHVPIATHPYHKNMET